MCETTQSVYQSWIINDLSALQLVPWYAMCTIPKVLERPRTRLVFGSLEGNQNVQFLATIGAPDESLLTKLWALHPQIKSRP